MENSTQSMNQVIESLPRIIKVILGTGSLNITTPLGYYGMLYLYLSVMLSVHAAMLGATIVSKEERDKTAEFLFSKPITRTYVMTSKLIASSIQMILLNIISFISSFLFIEPYNNETQSLGSEVFTFTAGLLLLQFIFLSIGTSTAAINKKSKAAPSIAAGILLFCFFLSVFIDITGKLDFFRYFTPFKYVVAEEILNTGRIDTIYVILSVVIMVLMTSMTYVFYQRRDINT